MSYHCLLLTVCFFCIMPCGYAKESRNEVKLHSDFPYLNKQHDLLLDLYCFSDTSFSGLVNICFYKYSSDKDSILMLKKYDFKLRLKSGNNKYALKFKTDDTNSYYDPKFYEILKRAKTIAPGRYKIFLALEKGKKTVASIVYEQAVDTILSPNSFIRKNINKTLGARQKYVPATGAINKSHTSKNNGSVQLSKRKSKIEKMAKKKGMTTTCYEQGNTSRIDLFYSDWFAGRYEINSKTPLATELAKQEKLGQLPEIDKGGGSGLSPQPSLFSKYKSHNKEKKEQEEIKGEIGYTNNLSSGQEEYSGIDNNFYELRGRVTLPVQGVPVEVEGYYTSQDKNKEVKSSYFKIHYDADMIKDELRKTISSYNGKYEENKSRGLGMEQIYGAVITSLENRKSSLERVKDPGENKINANGTNEKKEKIEELDSKISKYKNLLSQSRNVNFFDSSQVYSKTKDINKLDGLSEKQLLKRGGDLFPEGKAKSFLAGLTSLDAGMFSKNESKYTMGGQMVKGVDVGYDLGFCEAGGTVGKTEYAGRDGKLDKYTCYSGKLSFKPEKNQKIDLVYYGYTPDRKMTIGDNFFKNADISAPGFFNPVHILSTNYNGAIADFITVGAEVATSVKPNDKSERLSAGGQKDKIAYHFNTEVNIPHTSVGIAAAYDKTGKGFENSTLPMSLNGTEQYKLECKNDFFKSFLTVGIEYDRLVQTNLNATGTNTKWGFDVRTNSKRYPSVAFSYKPFATFRSFADTLNIPQRPLIGSVWTGKSTYQVKKTGRSQRSLSFSIIYNKCLAAMDTSSYGSTLLQASCSYSSKKFTHVASVGSMEMSGTNISSLSPSSTKFLTYSTAYPLSKQLNVNVGQDLGISDFGFCKYGTNLGVMCRIQKIPVSLNVKFRYNTYQLSEGSAWKNIYSGAIDINYMFKIRKKD